MQVDADDKKCADAFREYVVPAEMYRMLRDRSRTQPFALQRSLSYTAAFSALSRRCATSSGKAVWVSLTLPSRANPQFPRKGPLPLQTRVCKSYSVFIALCRKPSHEQAQAAFEPISVQHMRVPVQQRVAGCSAPLRLPPAGLPGSGEAPDLSTAGLHIVFIVSCHRCDLPVLLRGRARHMQATVSQRRAFGFLEAGESVLWSSVPVLQEALDAVCPHHHDYKRYLFSLLRLCLGGYRQLSSLAAISFEPGLAESDQREDIRCMHVDMALRFQDARFPLPPSARFLEPEPLRLKHPVDKLVAARARNGLLPWGLVYFRFFTSQKKYATECTTHCKCPLCGLSMSTFTGLQQHMRASHDLFDYGFSEDSPMRLPAVSVEVAAGVYSASHTFQSPEAAALGDSVSKEFYFYCPPGLRGEHGKLGRRAGGVVKRLLPEAECLTPASKRARLTYLATTKDGNKAAPPPEDLDLDDAAAPLLEGISQKKAKQRALVLPKIDLTRFYHARTCVQMSKAEVEGILADPQRASDSDDEEDVEDWKDRCRRKLAPRTDITSADKAFMFNWNCHLRTNPIHADWQVPAACEAFTFNNRHNILRSMELRRIFTMHLTGLYEFGLLSPNDINKCLRLLEF